ncbi:MAG: endonuclease [Candidatus Cloacimonadales bacterium]
MKNTLKFQIILIILLLGNLLLADIPEGYYDTAAGLSGDALQSALNNIIDNHNELSYSDLWNAICDTDQDPDNSSNVILLYTGWSVTNAGYPTWNREHTWAKSHGDFGNTAPCGTDLHHIRPTDPDVNSARGNLDFDNGGTQHPIATGCYYDDDSWEPRDEVKGDVARMIFYMATRYAGENGEPNLTVVDEVDTYPAAEHGKLSTLLEWNLQDPPDEFEMTRNDRIFENWQGNRNPFVDHPEFASYIWGGGNPELNAHFTAEPLSGAAPLLVNFTDLSSGDISSYEWDFDSDGEIDSTQQNPSYLYQEPGIYSVTLFVQSADDADEMTRSGYITVNEPGTDPIVLLNESFESGASTWEIVSYSSDADWEISSETNGYTLPGSVVDGSFYAYINNYGSDSGADDWLISPQISLSDYQNCTLSFYSWRNYSDSITGLKVLVKEDGANWQELPAALDNSEANVWTFSNELELTENVENLQLAFQYESSGTEAGECTAWAVDAVQILGYPLNNLAEDNLLPTTTLQVYPNPFALNSTQRNALTISYDLPKSAQQANLEIYNIRGQKINNFRLPTEQNKFYWSGDDQNKQAVPAGLYLLQLKVDGQIATTKKCIIQK